MQTVWINLPVRKALSHIELIEAKSALIGSLAYPGNNNEVSRIESSLKRLLNVPQRASTAQRIPSQKQAETILSDALEIIYFERLPASISYTTTYESAVVDGKVRGITSFAQQGGAIASSRNGLFPGKRRVDISGKNFLTRCWTPTKPVMHLALALQQLTVSGDIPDPTHLVNRNPWILDAVALAEWHRIQIIATATLSSQQNSWDSGLNINPEQLLRFVPRPLCHALWISKYNEINVPLFKDLKETC
ncbi:MAG: hypothetical protein HQM06_17715 [Magnetococcales bacterium]|nr:hypothetical protein [Magnetococcales bacterium]